MGTYLSTPVLDKHTERGCDESSDPAAPVRWAVVDMQGWRKSMEDAHVARTDVPRPSCASGGGQGGCGGDGAAAAKVFAVFDGHGGAEVARFCQTHLVPVLTAQADWGEAAPPSAGTENGAPQSGEGGQDAAGDAAVASRVGRALISSFHALDRLIDDPSSRPEIEKWRVERPAPYKGPGVEEDEGDAAPAGEGGDENGAALAPVPDGEDVQGRRHTVMDPSEIADSAAAAAQLVIEDDDDSDDVADAKEDKVGADGEAGAEAKGDDDDDEFQDAVDGLSNECADGTVRDDSDDDDASPAAAASAQGESASGEQGTMVLSANDAVALFQKLLHMNGDDEDDDDAADADAAPAESENTSAAPGDEASGERIVPTREQLLNPPTGPVAPSASVPTRVQNGRKVSFPAPRGCKTCPSLYHQRMPCPILTPSSAIQKQKDVQPARPPGPRGVHRRLRRHGRADPRGGQRRRLQGRHVPRGRARRAAQLRPQAPAGG